MSEFSDGGSEIFRHNDALLELLDDAGVSDLLDPGRPSVVAARRRRGLFRR